MAIVKELLKNEADGSISFGNYSLDKKAKLEDFKHKGDLLKVKTFKEITKLEKNGMFVYESVPGTSVFDFNETDSGMSFKVYGEEDAQITLGLMDDTEYDVTVGDDKAGTMKTGLGGKLSLNAPLSKDEGIEITIKRI